mgnify:CR=1 FL=1
MGRYAWSGLLGRSSKADKQAVAEAFALTHTEKFADQIVDTLSGGERSRIWLAMCLAQQSRFLLLDEPLAALDIAHQLEVMALIRDLSHRLHLGVIIVIHDINLAAQYCDELVALKQGRLLKQGKPAEIMTAEVLNDIYSVQMNIIRHPQTGVPVTKKKKTAFIVRKVGRPSESLQHNKPFPANFQTACHLFLLYSFCVKNRECKNHKTRPINHTHSDG